MLIVLLSSRISPINKEERSVLFAAYVTEFALVGFFVPANILPVPVILLQQKAGRHWRGITIIDEREVIESMCETVSFIMSSFLFYNLRPSDRAVIRARYRDRALNI